MDIRKNLANDGKYVSAWNFFPKPILKIFWAIPLYLIWGAIGYYYMGYSIGFMIKGLIGISVIIFSFFSLVALLINYKIWKETHKKKNE